MSKATEIFLIDGYNLLWRGYNFRASGGDLAAQRSMLEVQLKGFLRASPETQIVLVYDGAHFVSEGSSPRERGLEILYSRPPQTADGMIIEECERRRRAGKLMVVTSDVKDIVRRLKGVPFRHWTSEEFAGRLDALPAQRRPGASRPGKARAVSEKPGKISAAEVDEWLRIFSRPKKSRGAPPYD